MKDLLSFLEGTKNKTGLIAVLQAVLVYLTASAQLFSAGAMNLINTSAAVLLVLFKLFAPTGLIEKGWSLTFYIGNGLLAALGVVNAVAEGGYISPETLAVASVIINGGIAAFSTWKQNKPA